MGFNNQAPPVNEGDEFDVIIEAVGEKGDGIARKDGFVIFVSGTKKGDRVKIRMSKVLPKAGFATVVEHLEDPEKAEMKALESADYSEDFGEE